MLRHKKKIIFFVLFIGIIFYFDACKLARFVVYNFSDITDYQIFPERKISKPNTPFVFQNATLPFVPTTKDLNYPVATLEEFLRKNNTVAFLIIKDDSIHYQKYFDDYDAASIVASFSIAKSVMSLLVGIAIDEGYIVSENEKVTKYIPELEKNGFDNVTIKHLLQMTTTLDFNESYYNPLSEAASFYYGTRLRKDMAKLKLKAKPGTNFEYNSGNAQLLGWVLERALKGKNISQYLEEKIWHPLQMQYDASWSIDKKNNGIEKTFCCLNARALDFAKLGRLILQNGKWNNHIVVSESWIKKIKGKDLSDGAVPYYQYQFWKNDIGNAVMMQGHLGQFVYIHPDKNLLLIRLGKDKGEVNWKRFFAAVAKHY